MADRSVGDITVLAVDDSASIRKLVELTLRREGYAVVTADSGLKALAALARQRPDLLLLDVMLVALDGFQLCRVIREHPDYVNLPIVILSGRETTADAGASALRQPPHRPRTTRNASSSPSISTASRMASRSSTPAARPRMSIGSARRIASSGRPSCRATSRPASVTCS